MVGNFAAHLTRDEMAYGAQERGLNWGSIRAPDELVDEGHLNDRGFWVEVPHPELDRSFKYPGPAGIYNGSPWRISRRAPLIGEHNEEIYCGELGFKGRSWLTWRNREWCRPPRIIGLKHVLRRDWIVFMSAATAKPCWHVLLLRFEHLIKLDVAFLHEFIHLLRHRPDLLRHWVTFAVG